MLFFERFRGNHSPAEAHLIEPKEEERHVVAVFGAGASMAAGGIGVADIFKKGFTTRFERHRRWARTLKSFLRDVFCVNDCEFGPCTNLPDIILVLSLVDLAIDRGDSLVAQNRVARRKTWTHADLVEIREKLEGLIIQTVLDPYFKQFKQQRSAISPHEAARRHPRDRGRAIA